MHPVVHFNGEIVSPGEPSIAATSAAALYSKGVFTTVSVRCSSPFLWDKHWRRLTRDASRLAMDLSSFPETGVREALAEVIERNDLVSGRARITFFCESAGGAWRRDLPDKISLLIIAAEDHIPQSPLRITTSPFPVNSRSPLAGIKSCNYLENVMALDEAKARGFSEAIRVNTDGVVTSAVMANLFWKKGDRLYTTSISTGCLAGTTREHVLENCNCEEVSINLAELEQCDALFITSAGVGIIAVQELNSRAFDPIDHPILTLLQNN
ncbi:MAG: aminotransferase class IV [Pyrinomonadaceae bacterium]